MSTPVDTQSLMLQMRSLAAEAAAKPAPTQSVETGVKSAENFSELLSKSINEVAIQANKAGDMRKAFEKGEDMDLADVMIQAQKASLSFQAMTQVRNKLLEAYRDIKNMPI